MADGDAVLKCFSPLLSNMKLFGLYFTPASRRIQDAVPATSARTTDSKFTRIWNAGRIYAAVILVVIWLNAARMLSVFDEDEKFGVVLFLKLAGISAGLFTALQQTTCFVAC